MKTVIFCITSILLSAFISSSLLAQPSLHLFNSHNGKGKEIPIGTLLEVFQQADEINRIPPHLYFGSLLKISGDSLHLALLEAPRVKRSKFDKTYRKSDLMEYPQFYAVHLPSIEQVNKTSKYKRSFGATVVRTVTVGIIGASGVLAIAGVALYSFDSGIANAVLATSAISLGVGISLHQISKPKKYKFQSGKTGWKILQKKK